MNDYSEKNISTTEPSIQPIDILEDELDEISKNWSNLPDLTTTMWNNEKFNNEKVKTKKINQTQFEVK